MIRFYKESVTQIAVLIQCLSRYLSPERLTHIDEVLEENSIPGFGHRTLEELANILHDQLASAHNKTGDKDLIDAITDTLGLPFLPNHLSTQVLEQLRRALTVPSEYNDMIRVLKNLETKCYWCGGRFKDEE